MSKLSLAELKLRFEQGDKPTGQDFIDLIDSLGLQLDLAGGTMQGPVDFGGNPIKRYNDATYQGGTTAGNVTIDLANGPLQKFTLGGAHQFTMPAAADGASFTLILVGGASFTPTFSGVNNWVGTAGKAVAPVFAVAAGNINVLTFFAESGAWYGFLSGTGI